jgi:NAD+ diphosphatase
VPVVAGLVHLGGQYILARNSAWPHGLFSVISGFLEKGELPEHAIVRETKEELGLTAGDCKFIGHFELPENNQLIIAFAVEACGRLWLSEEIAEVTLVSHEKIAKFDFGHLELTRRIVLRWLEIE